MGRSWWFAGLMLVAGVLVGVTRDGVVPSVLGFAAFAVLAVLFSPLAFPRSLSAEQARARSARDGRPVVYWRPGCTYCLRLRLRLGRRARRAHWVDIWRDPEGAAAVRAVTGGDETVPTVVLPDGAVVNPDPAWLRARLAAGTGAAGTGGRG
ncbi:glutaredoxin domain-containing protein [Micromonospora sp. WMMC241]|uniref:glutaredoxin domain-containing protein n=1 Tax=Micromonospora sp. WMMC241 TaxID=3015159 RepID=UPI0022B69EE7|nr:glutaredoxin domain-containing protein [Micromonospora sp. WMMC241]MCZ7437346.1 glutaredoxin domain-containing protein [Micromonospora sp. WMMC241]